VAVIPAKFDGMPVEAMSNLHPNETGIPGVIIWVSAGLVKVAGREISVWVCPVNPALAASFNL
jgi:hypothetical protein